MVVVGALGLVLWAGLLVGPVLAIVAGVLTLLAGTGRRSST
jgi:hypothetical protein